MGFLAVIFRRWGLIAGSRPWTCLICSFIVVIGLSAGNVVMETENRPEKMWVPEGADSIAHKEYVDTNWPGDTGVEMYIATCPEDVTDCNMLEPAMLKELFKAHINFYSGLVNGTKLVEDNKDKYEVIEGDAETDIETRFGGRMWVLDKKLYSGNYTGTVTSKCAQWNDDLCDTTNIFWSLFDGDIVTGAHPKNPNYFDTQYTTLQQVKDRIAAYKPTGSNPLNKQRGQSPLSSFLGNIVYDSAGEIIGASHIFTLWGVTNTWVRDKSNDRNDILNYELEYHGLCGLGSDPGVGGKTCPNLHVVDSKLVISPFFQRSFPDAFEASVLGDLASLVIAYVLIVGYMFVQLGKRDSVHSLNGLALVTVLIVVSAMQAGTGLGFLLGVKNTNLVQILWFLILGLGVDDAFVLVAEFNRVSTQKPQLTITERVSATAETAGHSILVTSFTDALAFLVGALTILPALRGFCIFAGIAVIMCFLLQLTIFLPCLAINAARAETNRFDIFCCFKAKTQHALDSPQGCCCIPGTPNILDLAFKRYGKFIMKTPVRIVVVLLFLGVLAGGITGVAQFEMNFALEWFIPDDTPVQDFIAQNQAVFEQSQRSSVYIPNGTDHYAERTSIVDIGNYISTDKIFQAEKTTAWPLAFEAYLTAQANNGTAVDVSTADKYYAALSNWLTPPAPGARFQRQIQWKDKNDSTKGIFDSQMVATLSNNYTRTGKEKFDTLEEFRAGLDTRVKGAFPYTFSFLFWEEAGIMMQELIRNLIIAGSCIFVVIFLLIWDIKISLVVCLGLVCSIAEVIGYAHYWDVTANGTSVIFIILCIGLAVDYSAHIAHMFKISKGTSVERAEDCLVRIGPSVFNALMSTLLAVIVLAFAQSYVFRVFFKILGLTSVLAGAKGLLWLPVVLSLVGGSNLENSDNYETKDVENSTPETPSPANEDQLDGVITN